MECCHYRLAKKNLTNNVMSTKNVKKNVWVFNCSLMFGWEFKLKIQKSHTRNNDQVWWRTGGWLYWLESNSIANSTPNFVVFLFEMIRKKTPSVIKKLQKRNDIKVVIFRSTWPWMEVCFYLARISKKFKKYVPAELRIPFAE